VRPLWRHTRLLEHWHHLTSTQHLLQVLKRAYTYHWRMWTIPEARQMLLAAGFDAVHVWLRPMRTGDTNSSAEATQRPKGSEQKRSGRRGRRNGKQHNKPSRDAQPAEVSEDERDDPLSSSRSDGDEDEEEEAVFKEWTGIGSLTTLERTRINLGWTAYVVGVVKPTRDVAARLLLSISLFADASKGIEARD